MTYKVWIDSSLCTGDGLCSEIAPDVFEPDMSTGLWVVKEMAKNFGEDIVFDGREGPGHGPLDGKGLARIPDGQLDITVEAAEECPGECIFVELVEE